MSAAQVQLVVNHETTGNKHDGRLLAQSLVQRYRAVLMLGQFVNLQQVTCIVLMGCSQKTFDYITCQVVCPEPVLAATRNMQSLPKLTRTRVRGFVNRSFLVTVTERLTVQCPR